MGASATLRRMMAHDPVLTACSALSAIGLEAPLIVPPIRNAMNRPDIVPPPKLADVVEGMTGKSRADLPQWCHPFCSGPKLKN